MVHTIEQKQQTNLTFLRSCGASFSRWSINIASLQDWARKIILRSTEGHRPSAHRAAKPRRTFAFKRQRAASFYRMMGLTAIALFLFFAIVDWQRTAHANHESETTAVDERTALIESALYTRVE